MPGKDICREVNIVGGAYQEGCLWPVWDELYGSGWRAVRVFRAFAPSVPIKFHTVGNSLVERCLKVFSASEALTYNLLRRDGVIGFYYNHPLAPPVIYGKPKELFDLVIYGQYVISYGMLEATEKIEGEWVVYDPQSPNNPVSFRNQGGKAEHLALVMNESEAKGLTGKMDISDIKERLFEKEGCECLVIKRGAKGAIAFSSKEDKGTIIPVYKTSHVWPIGSGDVFTAVFSYFWFNGYDPALAALNASKSVSAYCQESGNVEVLPELLKKNDFSEYLPSKTGLVYLAGPFFNLTEKMFVSQCRKILKDMNVDVFSPYHDVGEGKAEDVAPKDIDKLKECSCVFAIVDGLDSGTLFEIGYAVAIGKKVVAYVENETEGALKMLEGTGCDIESDFTTAIYKTCWYATE